MRSSCGFTRSERNRTLPRIPKSKPEPEVRAGGPVTVVGFKQGVLQFQPSEDRTMIRVRMMPEGRKLGFFKIERFGTKVLTRGGRVRRSAAVYFVNNEFNKEDK